MELVEYKRAEGLLDRAGMPDMSQDPCAWWKINADKYPILDRMARKYLAIPAASAAVERMFSYTGNKVGKKNCNLGDEVLLSMLLIRSIKKFCLLDSNQKFS